MMRPALVILVGTAASIAGATADIAEAGSQGVLPVAPAAGVCKTHGPVLLTRGRSPLRRLRFDLRKAAQRSQAIAATDRVDAQTLDAAGVWQPSSRTDLIKAVVQTGKPAGGRLPTHSRVTLSGPSYPTRPMTTLDGYFDMLGGGAAGGIVQNDHLPPEAVGIGASWRVVNCDPIDQAKAKQTRTYTLRSLAHGVVELTFRDVVTIDPGQVELGSQRIGGRTVKFKAVTLQGSATGTSRMPLANMLAETDRSVTRAQISVQASAPNQPALLLHVKVVETQTLRPAR